MMVKDADLQTAVIDELDWEPGVNAAHIGVSARDGAVSLSGHVRTYAEKTLARKAALRVYGAKSVADEIEVMLGPEHKRDDEDIAEAVARALEWNAAVPATVKAAVQHATVTLSGAVEAPYQRAAAETSVRQMVGVRSVVNTITIAPKAPTKEVRARITAALHRQAQLEARRIDVEASDGKVILRGRVRSWEEAEAAERAAEAAPGITRVESQLEVVP